MSATDTKETPTPRVDAVTMDGSYRTDQGDRITLQLWDYEKAKDGDIVSSDFARVLERQLTAVTAQRDRALDVAKGLYGCLMRTKRECDDVDHSGGHCHEDHEECPVWRMIETVLAEYEALRKGER